jgi:hypothetical protein
MRVFNCWCKKSSPVRLVQQSNNALMWECLMCHGTVTVILEPGEEWKEKSCGG